MNALRRFDAWCRRGDLTAADLALFRIFFGGAVLLTLQQLDGVASQRGDQFDPPPGPIMLFESVPPPMVLEAIELATAVLAAMLLLGLRTRVVSILLPLVLMTGLGLLYSFGQIDHTIVLVLTPAVLAFSAWGDALSIDGASRRAATDVPQWPMRLLALLIGLSFLSAGWAKLTSGWAELHTHAVQAHFVREYFNGRDDWLAPYVLDMRVGRAWELLDWFTLALELGLVLTVLSWGVFRLALAVAAVFHLGVMLLMNIVFHANVIGYGAFFPWSRLVPVRPGAQLTMGRPAGYLLAVVVGSAVYGLHELNGDIQVHARTALVFVGAIAGVAYIVSQATNAARRGAVTASGT
jgi:hypothetical protein